MNRVDIYEKYGGRCAYCGHKIIIEHMEVDHMQPKRWYAITGRNPKEADRFENLMPSCHWCNHYKSACLLEEFRDWLLGELHIRITKLPKTTSVPATKRRKAYLAKICELYGIAEDKPFSRVFYFEKGESDE